MCIRDRDRIATPREEKASEKYGVFVIHSGFTPVRINTMRAEANALTPPAALTNACTPFMVAPAPPIKAAKMCIRDSGKASVKAA